MTNFTKSSEPSCWTLKLSVRCDAALILMSVLVIMVHGKAVDECGKDAHFDSARGTCRPCKDLCESPLSKRIVICKSEPKCKPFWPLLSTTPTVHEVSQNVTTSSTNLPDNSPAQNGMLQALVACLILLVFAVLVAIPLRYILKKGWLAKLHKSWFRRTIEREEEVPEIAQPLHAQDEFAAARPNESIPLVDVKRPVQVEAEHPKVSTDITMVTSRTVGMAPAVDHVEDTQVKVVY